jgi:hypothetical protein
MAVLGKFNARVDVAGSCFIACYRNFVRGRERRRLDLLEDQIRRNGLLIRGLARWIGVLALPT